jgi:hypothetical protein
MTRTPWRAGADRPEGGDIPDRLPTSEGEARASEYCRRGFAEAGLAPRTDEFGSCGSVFLPHQVVAVLMLRVSLSTVSALASRPSSGWPSSSRSSP